MRLVSYSKPHYRWTSEGPRFIGWLVSGKSYGSPQDQLSASASKRQSAVLGTATYLLHEGPVDVLFAEFMRSLGLTKEADARECLGIAPETLRTWRKRGFVPLQKRCLMAELVGTARSLT